MAKRSAPVRSKQLLPGGGAGHHGLGVLAARVDRVLAAAAAHGHRKLVLGAWGCGVFGNDPAVVAAAFAAGLARAGGSYDQVGFAVLDRQRGTPTHAAFARALGPTSFLEKR